MVWLAEGYLCVRRGIDERFQPRLRRGGESLRTQRTQSDSSNYFRRLGSISACAKEHKVHHQFAGVTGIISACAEETSALRRCSRRGQEHLCMRRGDVTCAGSRRKRPEHLYVRRGDCEAVDTALQECGTSLHAQRKRGAMDLGTSG